VKVEHDFLEMLHDDFDLMRQIKTAVGIDLPIIDNARQIEGHVEFAVHPRFGGTHEIFGQLTQGFRAILVRRVHGR
jgi:hypothetical protein